MIGSILENFIFINWLLSVGFMPFSSMDIGENSTFYQNNSFFQRVEVEFTIANYVNIFTTIDIFETKTYDIYFDPYRANFVIGLELRYNNFELGALHECNHDIITGWDFHEYNGWDVGKNDIYFGWSNEYNIKNPILLKPRLHIGYRPSDVLFKKPANENVNDYFGSENLKQGYYNNTLYAGIACSAVIYEYLTIDLMFQPEYSLEGYGWNGIKGKIGVWGNYKKVGIGIDWMIQARLNKNTYGTNEVRISVRFKGEDKDSGNKRKTMPFAKGKLTINGIPAEHNGKYIYVTGMTGETPLFGITGYAGTDIAYKLVKIKNGKAVVPLYNAKSGAASLPNSFTAYKGNDTISGLMIYPVSDNDGFLTPGEITPAMTAAAGDAKTVTSGSFSNGNLTVDW
ncbi:MAG: hypothetical protein LBG74_00045 [Spirochaetaceae bacterium]|jgi:hypothetical protein|nr:hypothetical protein [Spirochaetaceae bacterium]